MDLDCLGKRVKMVHTGERSDVGEAFEDHFSKGELETKQRFLRLSTTGFYEWRWTGSCPRC